VRAWFAATLMALAACASEPRPPPVHPEAELAPGHILGPIRAAMGDMSFTNATLVREGVMEVEGYRSDGAYRFEVMQKGDRWELTHRERLGDAPAAPPPPER
jgi:hypothetical protein